MAADREPTQKTPKGARIPVPKRGDVMRDLRKVAKDARVMTARTDQQGTLADDDL